MSLYTLAQSRWDAAIVQAEVEKIVSRMRSRAESLAKRTDERVRQTEKRLTEKVFAEIRSIENEEVREIAARAASEAAALVADAERAAALRLLDEAKAIEDRFLDGESELASQVRDSVIRGMEIESRLAQALKEAHGRALAVEMATEAIFLVAEKNEERRDSDAEVAASRWADLLRSLTKPPGGDPDTGK